MITLFLILCIICIIMMSKKDKHNVEEDAAAISGLPSFSITAKPMSAVSKIINLAVTKSELLKSFSYANERVTIVMENGNSLNALLSEMSVQFEKSQGIIIYTVKGNGRKVNFYYTTNISNKEWEAINSVLCLAATTHGRNIFFKETQYAGYINMALKAIKMLS